jgi:alkylation response protein AidB-like acyl-CoA dehydrogenase
MTDSLEVYRARARAWLAQHSGEFGAKARRGLGEAGDLALGRRWQRTKFEAGYTGIAWKKEYGGGGLSELEAVIFAEEEALFGFPTQYFGVSLGQPVPILNKYAPEHLRKRFSVAALKGDEIWCQLFSEPAAGSDLAGIRLRAERQGEYWVLNGQKLWTSGAHYSDYGIILTRTDSHAPKHRGLTCFWLSMKSPGIVVRPVRLASGSHDVNEVFFDGVHVPDAQRLGGVGEGFIVAMNTLFIERYTAADEAGFGTPLTMFIERASQVMLNGRPAIEDGRTRRDIADAFRLQKALAAIRRRTFLSAMKGIAPGAEGAIYKLASVRARQRLSAAAMNLLGAAGVTIDTNSHPREDWACSWLTAPTLRIAGGADEMLLNTIAEKILGLPQDYRPDKSVPFDEIKPVR